MTFQCLPFLYTHECSHPAIPTLPHPHTDVHSFTSLSLTVSHSQFLHPHSCAITHSHTHISSHFTHIYTHTQVYHATQVLIVTLTPIGSHFICSRLHHPHAHMPSRLSIYRYSQLTHTQYTSQHIHTNSHSLMVIHTFSLAHSHLRSPSCTHSL